jgi:hypothetical protein
MTGTKLITEFSSESMSTLFIKKVNFDRLSSASVVAKIIPLTLNHDCNFVTLNAYLIRFGGVLSK